MRILVDVRHLAHRHARGAASGVGEYTVQLLCALFSLDMANEYVLLSTGMRKPDLSALHRPNVSHMHVPIPNKLLNLSLLATGHPYLDRLAGGTFDLYFLPNHNITRLSPGLPLVLTVHDLTWKIFPAYYGRKMRVWHRAVAAEALVARAQAIVTPSTATNNDVVRFLKTPEERIHVIAHGIDPSFSPKPEVTDHGVKSRLHVPKRYALFMGTLEPRKNLLETINAIKAYRDETGDDLHFVVAGSRGWNSDALRLRFLDADVRPWIHVLGYVKGADRPALYRNAEVFVWPSLYEGFGLPVLEAMACGTPVITSVTSSLPEVAGDAALLVDPYSPGDITEALRELRKSPELRVAMRERGLERAKRFSWETAAKKTREVFAKVR